MKKKIYININIKLKKNSPLRIIFLTHLIILIKYIKIGVLNVKRSKKQIIILNYKVGINSSKFVYQLYKFFSFLLIIKRIKSFPSHSIKEIFAITCIFLL